jgi:hypothetical protein
MFEWPDDRSDPCALRAVEAAVLALLDAEP